MLLLEFPGDGFLKKENTSTVESKIKSKPDRKGNDPSCSLSRLIVSLNLSWIIRQGLIGIKNRPPDQSERP
jgi:hypothetical protein